MKEESKPAPSRLDPEAMPRRDVLGLAAVWSMAATGVFALIGMLRLPRAAVVSSASKKFRVTLPDNLASGEAFVPEGRSVALFRDDGGIFAVSTICTHLGCIVKSTPDGFLCPCHGSTFSPDGSVTAGPAPKALPWIAVQVQGGNCIIDMDTTVPAGTKVKV